MSSVWARFWVNVSIASRMLFLKRSRSFAAVFLDELDQPLLFEHIAFHVLGFGLAVRIDDEKIALIELNRNGAVVCKGSVTFFL